MPLASEAEFTVTVIVPGLTPAVGLIDNQLLPTSVFALAVHPSALEKLLSTWKVCVAGLLPAVATNCSALGASEIAEAAACTTVKVTASVCGELPAPEAAT